MSRIEEIKERLSKVTKGEWFTDICNSGESCWCRTVGNKKGSDALEDCIIPSGAVGKLDAEFIASSKSDIEYLLAEIEKRDDIIRKLLKNIQLQENFQDYDIWEFVNRISKDMK